MQLTKLEQALYDWWPGYKAGTLLYNQTIGDGRWTGWEVLDAASVGTLGVGRGLQALQALRAGGAAGVEFGANLNVTGRTTAWEASQAAAANSVSAAEAAALRARGFVPISELSRGSILTGEIVKGWVKGGPGASTKMYR